MPFSRIFRFCPPVVIGSQMSRPRACEGPPSLKSPRFFGAGGNGGAQSATLFSILCRAAVKIDKIEREREHGLHRIAATIFGNSFQNGEGHQNILTQFQILLRDQGSQAA
jgi:hypothetical protein